ncbi:MAG TPA: Uma2 family endonuclease [Thermomicrobiales bacterium]|nr:Uma2 family endonuclease [Thermomicrobiales bacterium]
MAITTRKMTAEELWALPEDQRGELIRGEMTPVTPVARPHWRIVGRLLGRLDPFVEARGLGDVGAEGGFLLARDPDVVLAPDVSFVRAGREADDQPGFMPLAPDLAIEVISPSNSVTELSRRVRLYLDAGVRQVWIVDPYERTIALYAPDRTARLYVDGETLDGGDVLPGFALAVGDLFG